MKRGTLAISWGAWGGCYVQRGYTWRVCVGWVALTYVPIELDDLCAGYIAHKRAEQQAQARDFVNRSREDCQPQYMITNIEFVVKNGRRSGLMTLHVKLRNHNA